MNVMYILIILCVAIATRFHIVNFNAEYNCNLKNYILIIDRCYLVVSQLDAEPMARIPLAIEEKPYLPCIYRRLM